MNNKLYTINNNAIITSDWHICHKNIWDYEWFSRKPIVEQVKNINNRFDFNRVFVREQKRSTKKNPIQLYTLELDGFLLDVLFNELTKNKNILRKNNKFIMAGDFIFHLSQNKLDNMKKLNIVKKIKKIFNLFKEHNIETILVRGNHDYIANKTYKTLFDKIVYKYWLNSNNIITHYPVGSSTVNKIQKHFNENDKEILKEIEEKRDNKNTKIINQHGHIHSNEIYEENRRFGKNNNITYKNICLDNILLNNQDQLVKEIEKD